MNMGSVSNRRKEGERKRRNTGRIKERRKWMGSRREGVKKVQTMGRGGNGRRRG